MSLWLNKGQRLRTTYLQSFFCDLIHSVSVEHALCRWWEVDTFLCGCSAPGQDTKSAWNSPQCEQNRICPALCSEFVYCWMFHKTAGENINTWCAHPSVSPDTAQQTTSQSYSALASWQSVGTYLSVECDKWPHCWKSWAFARETRTSWSYTCLFDSWCTLCLVV